MRALGLVLSASESSESMIRTSVKWSEHTRAVSSPEMLDMDISSEYRERYDETCLPPQTTAVPRIFLVRFKPSSGKPSTVIRRLTKYARHSFPRTSYAKINEMTTLMDKANNPGRLRTIQTSRGEVKRWPTKRLRGCSWMSKLAMTSFLTFRISYVHLR